MKHTEHIVIDYKDKVLNSDKYNKMGVNPKELFLRQTEGCWLTLIYDNYGKEKKCISGLYCTDGKEYAETDKMLNPTFECIKCLSKFIIKKIDE